MISHLLRLGRLGAIAGLLLATFGVSGASAAASAAARASIWSVVPTVSPQSGQLDNSFLEGVSMTSATDGWAVGEFMDPTSVIHPLVEHWTEPGGSTSRRQRSAASSRSSRASTP